MTNQIPAFGVTNIPVYINGRFVYSSSVQRVLQLAANIYDASTNSFFPSVFRPLFSKDSLSNIVVIGYTNLNSSFVRNTVSGQNDLQLSIPFDAAAIAALNPGQALNLPGVDNIYGVPWIVGAKKGFPNFNEFSMNNAVQITRKLQVKRANYSYPPQFSFTNEAYVFGIGSSLGIEYWNSYTNSYNRPVQIVVNEKLSLALTNNDSGQALSFPNTFLVFTNMTVQEWLNKAPQSFVYQLTNITFVTNQTYLWGGAFTSPNSANWQTNITDLRALPQFGLLTTNRLQTFILDGNHVIDYAHFAGPDSSRNLNAEIQSNLGNQASYLNMWTTNLQAPGGPAACRLPSSTKSTRRRIVLPFLCKAFIGKIRRQPPKLTGFGFSWEAARAQFRCRSSARRRPMLLRVI